MAAAMTGVVFDIRELTVHDGPGLRTTVFLKGCPLRCAWCHNPEGLSPAPQALRSAAGERVAGREYSSLELATLLNRQAPLLREIGGVTFSGGEPLMQAAFVAETIRRLEGLHVTLGTSGCAEEEDFRLVARRCNLVLFDLKLMDAEAHRRWTGQDNDSILRNLAVLAALGTPFVVRVPLVPGVTDTDENLRAIAAHLSMLPHRARVELLPYHRAAGGKYAACGLDWRPAYDESAPVNANLEPFADLNVEASIL
jgi:pyruvate formate lyase activating enzyme